MAFRRFRRRNRGYWLPTIQSSTPYTTTVNADFSVSADVTQILFGDDPFNNATSAGLFANLPGSIGLATGTGIYIKRIVGKLHIGFLQTNEEDVISATVKAGIFVDRTNSTGALDNLDAWNPFAEGSSPKRWLWRRSWWMGNYPPASGIQGTTDFLTYNGYAGDIQNGPHIDAKVRAHIGYEERLFIGVWTTATQVVSQGTVDGHIEWQPDLRVFGMRSSIKTR